MFSSLGPALFSVLLLPGDLSHVPGGTDPAPSPGLSFWICWVYVGWGPAFLTPQHISSLPGRSASLQAGLHACPSAHLAPTLLALNPAAPHCPVLLLAKQPSVGETFSDEMEVMMMVMVRKIVKMMVRKMMVMKMMKIVEKMSKVMVMRW